ncbi:hypothetical protein [Planctobacterium marinum]|uniref:Uncharacterized protein n=1 Tax=Planctobacterium marinum TaxID=1631968 RepID=A0AA48HKB9_9ALTE|nr:hypothetical protein MACH26_18620 [Planctobacterium marinum]
MSKLDKDQVIAKFTEAYTAANGKAPEIEAKGGWYSVDGGKNMRLAQLDEMADELAGNKAAAPKEAEAPKKAKKAEAKPAAEKAPKTAAPKKAKAEKSGFSVKAFWNEKLDNEHPGSTLPR